MKDSIEIHDGALVKAGDTVHLIVEDPYTDEEYLRTGKVVSIASLESGYEFAEVAVNTVIFDCSPLLLFSTREALIEQHINTLLGRVEMIQEHSNELKKMIVEDENEMGLTLVKIHELKEEIEAQ